MTAPALPGAAPDPAPDCRVVDANGNPFGPMLVKMLHEAVESVVDHPDFNERCRLSSLIAQAAAYIAAVVEGRGPAMRAATAGSGAASPAAGASARALGGDGEPVAWGLLNGYGKLDTRPYLAAKDAERHRVVEKSMGRTLRVVPLYTRPAATGDTVGAAARALVKAAIDARADEAVTGIIVPEAEWDALLAALRSTPGGGACG